MKPHGVVLKPVSDSVDLCFTSVGVWACLQVSGMMSDAEPSIARVSKQFAAKFSSTREEAELVEDDG